MDKKTVWNIFIENNPKIAECGINKFTLVSFPLALSTMTVHEHIREDYSALEYVVLRLIAAGITGVDFLCEATGLTERMIRNIIQNEKDYNHIDDKLNVLEGGLITLQEESNTIGSEKYINHKCYDNPRELQFDALTKTVIAGDRKYVPKYNNYAFDYNDKAARIKNVSNIETLDSKTEITEIIKKDIIDGLYDNYSKWEDITIDKISNINITENKKAYGYYVETNSPEMTFIAIRTQKLNDNGDTIIGYEPIAIPKGKIDNSDNKYIEKDESYFADLLMAEDNIIDNDYDLEEMISKYKTVLDDAMEVTSQRIEEDKKQKK